MGHYALWAGAGVERNSEGFLPASGQAGQQKPCKWPRFVFKAKPNWMSQTACMGQPCRGESFGPRQRWTYLNLGERGPLVGSVCVWCVCVRVCTRACIYPRFCERLSATVLSLWSPKVQTSRFSPLILLTPAAPRAVFL